jgi:hypothetical protein
MTIYNFLSKILNQPKSLNKDSNYRLLSKKVVNFILNYPRPSIIYNNLVSVTGFNKNNLFYDYEYVEKKKKNSIFRVNETIINLISKNRLPIRFASFLMFFGSLSNLLYSLYVVLILIFKSDVAPGWVTLSLQQSGMFFLISLVLLIISEHITNLSYLTNEGPLFYIGQEFTSENIKRIKKLNVEDLNNNNIKKTSGIALRSSKQIVKFFEEKYDIEGLKLKNIIDILDILEGKNAGCRTVGVLTGADNREKLEKNKPDFIVDNIVDIKFD